MFCFLGLLGLELETPTANTGSTLLGLIMIIHVVDLSIIITTMNHYSCLTTMRYSYIIIINNRVLSSYATFVLLLSLPARNKAANESLF